MWVRGGGQRGWGRGGAPPGSMGSAGATPPPPAPPTPGPPGAGKRGRGRGRGRRRRVGAAGAAAGVLLAAGALLRLGGAGVEAGAEAVWPEEAAGAASVTVFGAAVEEHWLKGKGWSHGLDVHCHFGTAKARAAPGSGGLLCRLPPLPPGFVAVALSPNGVDVEDVGGATTLLVSAPPRPPVRATGWLPTVVPGSLVWLPARDLHREPWGRGAGAARGGDGGCILAGGRGGERAGESPPGVEGGGAGTLQVQSSALAACEVPFDAPLGPATLNLQGLEASVEVEAPVLCIGAGPEARVLPAGGGMTFTAQVDALPSFDETLLCRFGPISVRARRSGAASVGVDCTSPALAPTVVGARGQPRQGRLWAPGLAHVASGAGIAECLVDGAQDVSVHPAPRAKGVVAGHPDGGESRTNVLTIAVEGPPPEPGTAAFCLAGPTAHPALSWSPGETSELGGHAWAWTARCALNGAGGPPLTGAFVEISAGSASHLLYPGRGVSFSLGAGVGREVGGGTWTAASVGAFEGSGAALLRQSGPHGGGGHCPEGTPSQVTHQHSYAVVSCEVGWSGDAREDAGHEGPQFVEAAPAGQPQASTGPAHGGVQFEISLSGTPSGLLACFIGAIGPLPSRSTGAGAGSGAAAALACVAPGLAPTGGGDVLLGLDAGVNRPPRGYPVSIGAQSGAGTRLRLPGSDYFAIVEPVPVSAAFEAGHAAGGYGGIDRGSAVVHMELGASSVLSWLARNGQLGCLAGSGSAPSAAGVHDSAVLCGPEVVAGLAPPHSSFYSAGVTFPWGQGESVGGLQWSVSRAAPALLHALPAAPASSFGDIVRLKSRHAHPGARCVFHESVDSVALGEPDGDALSSPPEQRGTWAETLAHVVSSALVVCEIPEVAGTQIQLSWGAVSLLRGASDPVLGLRSSNSVALLPGGGTPGPVQTWDGGSGLVDGGTAVTSTTWGLDRALMPAMAFGTVRVAAQALPASNTVEAVAPALVPKKPVTLRVSATGVAGAFGLEGRAHYTALPSAGVSTSSSLGVGGSQRAAWPPSVQAGSHVLLASEPHRLSREKARLVGCFADGGGASTCTEAPAVTELEAAYAVFLPPGAAGAVSLTILPAQVLSGATNLPSGVWAGAAEAFIVASPEAVTVWPGAGPAGEDAVVWVSARGALPSSACSQPLTGLSAGGHYGPALVACELHFAAEGHRDSVALTQPASNEASGDVGFGAPFIAGASVEAIGGLLGSAVAAPLVTGSGLPRQVPGHDGSAVATTYVTSLRPAEAVSTVQTIVGAAGGGVLEVTTAGGVDFDTGVGRGWPACFFGSTRVDARPLLDSNVACAVPAMSAALRQTGAPGSGGAGSAAGLNFVGVGIAQGPGPGLAPRRRVHIAVQPEPAIVSVSAADTLEELRARGLERAASDDPGIDETEGLWVVVTGVGDWLAHLRCTFAAEGALAAPLRVAGGDSGDTRPRDRVSGSSARAAVGEWAVCQHPPFPASGIAFATVQVLGQGEGRPIFSGAAQAGGGLDTRLDAVVPGRGVQSGGGSIVYAFGKDFPAGRRFLLGGAEALAVSSAVAIVEAPPAPPAEGAGDPQTPREPALEVHPRFATSAGALSNLPLEWVKTWVVESAWPPLGPDTGGVEIEILGRGPAPAHGESGRPVGVCRFGSTGPVAGRAGGKAGGVACLAPAHGPGEAVLRVAFDGGSDWSATFAAFRY